MKKREVNCMKERDLTIKVQDYKLNVRAAGIIIHKGILKINEFPVHKINIDI